MVKRVYSESVKKWLIGIGATGGTLVGAIFAYLAFIGAITVTGYSGDVACAGTLEDPCYAYINFTANEDIFLYPIDYDPYGRNTTFVFDPNVKSWKLQRSWGTSWRDIPLNATCTGTWCGGLAGTTSNSYSIAFRKGTKYNIRIVAYKHNPSDSVKWSAFEGKIDPKWLPVGQESSDVSCTPDKLITQEGNRFNVIQYQQVHYVNEDGYCKNVTQARSLKGSGINCVVIKENSNDTDVECLDWNWTHRVIKATDDSGIIPIRVENSTSSKEISTLDFSTKGSYNFTVEIKESEELHIGENSTIVVLNSTEYSWDTYVDSDNTATNFGTSSNLQLANGTVGNDGRFVLQTWDISNLSSLNTTIDLESSRYFFNMTANALDAGEAIRVDWYHLYDNYSFKELVATWANRPLANNSEYNTTSEGNRSFWTGESTNVYSSIDVTNIINKSIRTGHGNASIYYTVQTLAGTPANTDIVQWASSEEAKGQGYLNSSYVAKDIPAVVSPFCLQESANKSTSCGAIDGGNYSQAGIWNPFNNTHDEDYASTGGVDALQEGIFFVTYLKPSNATNQSIWQIKTAQDVATGPRNFTIPSSCWSNLNMTFKVNASNVLGQTTGFCLSGSTYVQIFQDVVGAALYEEALWLYMNGTYAQTERCACPGEKSWGLDLYHACVITTNCSLGNGKLYLVNNGTANISGAVINASGNSNPKPGQGVFIKNGGGIYVSG